jgi:hypothetical protein
MCILCGEFVTHIHWTEKHAEDRARASIDALRKWPDEDRRSRIIFITRGIRSEELLASMEAFRSIVGAGPRLLEANAPV